MRTAALLVLVGVLAGTPAATAQENGSGPRSDELHLLREEVAALRAELAALRRLIMDPEPTPVAADTHPGQEQPPPSDPRITMLQTQVAELARSKVESEMRFPLRVFGTIHTHMFANSGEPNWMDVPNIVQPPPPGGHTGSFSATLRQTRLGLAADGPTIGGARTSGIVAMDFFGGIPGFPTGQVMPLPRLVVGFTRIESDRLALQVGQDHVILAPRDPSSLAGFAFPLLFRSGNLYLRAPQARVEAALSPTVRLTAGILAPIAGDVPGENYRFVPPALGGERSRHPAFQAHLGYASDAAAVSTRRVELGVSGHIARELRDGVRHTSWAGAVDFGVRHDRIGAAGEFFTGRDINALGGGTGIDGRGDGGWAEVQIYPRDRLMAAAGIGVDRLRGNVQLLPRRGSRSAYGNIRFALTPELEASAEYHRLMTRPGTGSTRGNHHFDWVLVYRF
jgi:hypothetical protein